MIGPSAVNVMTTNSVGVELDLVEVAKALPNSEYDPRRFSCCTVRMRKPRTTAMIFKTGAINMVGATSIEEARCAARKIAKKLQVYVNANVRFLNFSIKNIVCVGHVGRSVHVPMLAKRNNLEYNSELFSGLSVKFKDLNTSATVFHSGKINFMGSKTMECANRAFERLCSMINDSS